MSTFHPTSLFDKVFEGGLLLKGASGALEFFTGLLLLFVSPDSVRNFVALITQRELLEDPQDKIANLLQHSTQHIGGSRTFLIVYLWIHALIKLVAVIGILKNQLWAYPFSLVTLGMLMLYQLYTIVFVRPTAGMILLTIFDVFVLWLIWREYGRIKPALANAHGS